MARFEGKLRQNTTRRTALMGREHLTCKEKYSHGASYSVRTGKVLCTLMRDTDVPHFTEIFG